MNKYQEDFEPVFEGMSFSNIDCKGFPDSVTISNGKDLYHFETRDYVPLEAVEELVERATPKPVNKKRAIMSLLKTHILLHTGHCPICDKAVSHSSCVEKDGLFCNECGQALDWSEE